MAKHRPDFASFGWCSFQRCATLYSSRLSEISSTGASNTGFAQRLALSTLKSPTISSLWRLRRELDDLEPEDVLEATVSGCESESVFR